MANESIKSLGTIIRDLHAQRQAHESAIMEIDQAFMDLGIDPGAASSGGATRGAGSGAGKKRGRVGRPKGSGKRGRVGRPPKTAKPAGAKKTKKRHRGKFAVTGMDSIVSFVGKGGKKGRTGSEIDKHWQSEGRKGAAYSQLGQLVKEGRVKRENVKGQRGSVYRLP